MRERWSWLFESPSPEGLFLVGGEDQSSVIPPPNVPSRVEYGSFVAYSQGAGAIESMQHEGYDSWQDITPTLSARDERILRISDRVPNARKIDEDRQKLARALTAILRSNSA